MYASHLSYTNDAMLGEDECDLLVRLMPQNEHKGFYGTRSPAAAVERLRSCATQVRELTMQ